MADKRPLPALWLKEARGSTSHHGAGLGGKQPDSGVTPPGSTLMTGDRKATDIKTALAFSWKLQPPSLILVFILDSDTSPASSLQSAVERNRMGEKGWKGKPTQAWRASD